MCPNLSQQSQLCPSQMVETGTLKIAGVIIHPLSWCWHGAGAGIAIAKFQREKVVRHETWGDMGRIKPEISANSRI
jgi:hypothetical protein